MNILFIHQNFPGQYKHLAPALAKQGHKCVALTLRVDKPGNWNGVRVLPYKMPKRDGQNVHPWLTDMDTKVTRAEACYRAALKVDEAGFKPDLILAHHGWGEPMFLKDIWPDAKLAIYCELYHKSDYPHANFDPEFETNSKTDPMRLRMKNINNHLHFDMAEVGISPTKFQADTFPAEFRDKIFVCHDGVNTQMCQADPDVELSFKRAGTLTRDDEVITFINRNLEPYRGYHRFMRALPRLLKERPNARVLIVGGDDVSYGSRPPNGQTWKQIFIDEVRGTIPTPDWERVHFLGKIPYTEFIKLLQLSRVHIYLTYPFVLSWSLMESMACEAAIVASDVAPVREVIEHDVNGRLVDFFDGDALVDEVNSLLDDPETRQRLGKAAREKMVSEYDLETICLPKLVEWVNSLVDEKETA